MTSDPAVIETAATDPLTGAGPVLAVTADRDGLVVHAADARTDAGGPGGHLQAAGLLGEGGEGGPDQGLAAVVAALAAGATTFEATPRRPWAVVAHDRRDGSVTAVVNQAVGGSLAVAVEGDRLHLSTHTMPVARRLSRRPGLDPLALARLLDLTDPPEQLPFLGLTRVPEGHLLRWRPGGVPLVHRWFTLPESALDGDLEELDRSWLRTFDDAVAALLPRGGDVVATLSGGLDSSAVLVSAAAALAPTGRRVVGVTAAPLDEESSLVPGGWDADETALTALLADRPGAALEIWRNTARLDPITSYERSLDRRAMPVRNPANQVWIDAIAARAACEPGAVMLTGGMGNASFSPDRDDAYAELVRARSWGQLAASVRERSAHDAMAWPLVVRHRIVPSLMPEPVRRLRRRGRQQTVVDLLRPEWHDRLDRTRTGWKDIIGLNPGRWRDWMTGSPGLALGQGAAALGGAWWRDPFGDRELLLASARLPARAWLAGGTTRALARRTQAGRLPDAVRLRTRRGAQAPDWATWLAPHRDAFGDRLTDLARSPLVADLVDLPRARRLIDDWPDEFRYEHTVLYDLALSRALVLGTFVRWWEQDGGTG